MHVFSRPSFAAPASAAPQVAPRFTPGTVIDAPGGPRAVETLTAGDLVSTRDGPRAVAATGLRSVPREDWTYRRELWPIRVPVGSLGNAVPLRLPPDQRVMLHGPALEKAMGAPEVWVAIGALVGLRGLAVDRPLGVLRQHGLALEGGGGAVCASGVWCDLAAGGQEPARDQVRAAFSAMNAAGEPRLG